MPDPSNIPTPNLITAVTKSGVYRARDVRADIKEMGFERGIERSVTLMADEIVGLRQTVSELAQLLDALIDRFTDMTNTGEQMAKMIDRLRSRDEKYEASKET